MPHNFDHATETRRFRVCFARVIVVVPMIVVSINPSNNDATQLEIVLEYVRNDDEKKTSQRRIKSGEGIFYSLRIYWIYLHVSAECYDDCNFILTQKDFTNRIAPSVRFKLLFGDIHSSRACEINSEKFSINSIMTKFHSNFLLLITLALVIFSSRLRVGKNFQ